MSAWSNNVFYTVFMLFQMHHSMLGGSVRKVVGNVTVMAPRFAQGLLLLSPVMHWGVLINTNAWYGCEEGIQTLVSEVFEHCKLCDPPTYASREVEVALRGVKCFQIYHRVSMDPIY